MGGTGDNVHLAVAVDIVDVHVGAGAAQLDGVENPLTKRRSEVQRQVRSPKSEVRSPKTDRSPKCDVEFLTSDIGLRTSDDFRFGLLPPTFDADDVGPAIAVHVADAQTM